MWLLPMPLKHDADDYNNENDDDSSHRDNDTCNECENKYHGIESEHKNEHDNEN